MRIRNRLIWMVAVLAVAAFVLPSGYNYGFPDKIKDCSGCHGPSAGTYYDSYMTITVSKTTLAPGESYTVGIDIVIQTQLTKKQTGYAIEDLTAGTWPALGGPADQSHYDQVMTAPTTVGTYTYRVWGESGPATSDGKADYDDYTIVVQVANSPPVVTPLVAKTGNAGDVLTFSATATDADLDALRYTWNFGDSTPLQVGNVTTHTYAKAGTYTFRVYVDDLTGIPLHNVSSSATAKIAFNLPLVAGWNLVSLPFLNGAGYRASNLTGLVTGDLVVEWNTTTQTYSHTYIKGVSGAAQNFNLNASTGYWIWVASSKTLHLFGTIPTTTQSRTITMPASGSGWVTLGFVSLNTTRHARDIPAMYSPAGKVTTIATFDPVTKAFKTWLSVVPTLNNFLLVPGQGYWAYITSSGILSYSP